MISGGSSPISGDSSSRREIELVGTVWSCPFAFDTTFYLIFFILPIRVFRSVRTWLSRRFSETPRVAFSTGYPILNLAVIHRVSGPLTQLRASVYLRPTPQCPIPCSWGNW